MRDDFLQRPLLVARMIGTRRDDAERGPAIWLHPDDARDRLLQDGELAWIYGPRRHELATVHIEPSARRGEVILRDILGAAPAEIIRVVKPDLDPRGRRMGHLG